MSKHTNNRPIRPVSNRLTEKVNKDPISNCHLWTAHINNRGYGVIKVNGKMKLAHRVSLEIHLNTIIPNDKLVLHSCDTPSCINPEHLRIGSHKENANDKYERNRGHHPSGSNHGRATLNEKQVKEIRRSKLLQKELAKIYHTSQSNIDLIKRRVTWKKI
jgi:hypothetical protein